MMMFVDLLKKEDLLDCNTSRLNHLSKLDNSYIRFPVQEVISGAL